MDTEAAPGLRPRRALVSLCVTEVTSWGVLYYAFPVLAPSISADTGWSVPAVTAGFSLGLVVSAVAGVPVGRLLDRVGPRPVMTGGTLLAVPATLALAGARTLPEFFAAWVVAGLAMSAVLYQPAFAALTRWYGPRRVAALTILALAAAMSLAALAVYAAVVNLVPLLHHRGLSTSDAALALGLGGVGQVLGRLGYGRLTAATTVRTRTAIVLLAAAGTIVLLGLLPGPFLVLIAAAMLAGAARGIVTLLQATAVTDRWGATHYGRLNGLLSAPSTFAAALAPWAGAALAGPFGGYPALFCLLGALAAVAAVLATVGVPAVVSR